MNSLFQPASHFTEHCLRQNDEPGLIKAQSLYNDNLFTLHLTFKRHITPFDLVFPSVRLWQPELNHRAEVSAAVTTPHFKAITTRARVLLVPVQPSVNRYQHGNELEACSGSKV